MLSKIKKHVCKTRLFLHYVKNRLINEQISFDLWQMPQVLQNNHRMVKCRFRLRRSVDKFSNVQNNIFPVEILILKSTKMHAVNVCSHTRSEWIMDDSKTSWVHWFKMLKIFHSNIYALNYVHVFYSQQVRDPVNGINLFCLNHWMNLKIEYNIK